MSHWIRALRLFLPWELLQIELWLALSPPPVGQTREEMEGTSKSVLIVENDKTVRDVLARLVSRMGGVRDDRRRKGDPGCVRAVGASG